MSGIAGVFLGKESRFNTHSLRNTGLSMCQMLAHRGPDQSGVYLIKRNDEKSLGVVAHTRLSIIDLSERARQPFVSSDEKIVLVFNGEIYNYRELRQELISSGIPFRSDSDTEVILEIYRAEGLNGLKRLDGMFALAIFDLRSEQAFLMRDPMGKKPLYFTLLPSGDLVFSSEIKALFAQTDFIPEADLSHLPELLSFGYISTPNSFVRKVQKLEPATILCFTRNAKGFGRPRLSFERYWDLPEPTDTSTMPFEDAAFELRKHIQRAVKRRLSADVPVGAFLSGGIDSSVIVYEMATLLEEPVRTFTVGFKDNKSFDETFEARIFAEQLHTKHTEIITDWNIKHQLENLLQFYGEPYGDSSGLALFGIAKATRRHTKVILTGDGGDEIFAGHTRFLGGIWQSRIPRFLKQSMHRFFLNIPSPRLDHAKLTLLKRFVEYNDRESSEQFLAWNSFFVGQNLASLLGKENDGWSQFIEQTEILSHGRDHLDQILRHNFKTYLLDNLLVKADRMSMSVGLETRSPFLDKSLVEFMFRLPSNYKIRHSRMKALLKYAYRGLLPNSIIDRKKQRLSVPLSTWWAGPLRSFMHDHLFSNHSEIAGILDLHTVRKLVREHEVGVQDHSQRIFLLIQIELFLKSLRTERNQQLESLRTSISSDSIHPVLYRMEA